MCRSGSDIVAANNRVIELMTDGQSDEAIFPFLVERLKAIGYHPIVARKESTGFVINRLWAAIKRETLTILSEGVSVPEELDSVVCAASSLKPMFVLIAIHSLPRCLAREVWLPLVLVL